MSTSEGYLERDGGAIHYRKTPGSPFIVYEHGHGGDINGFERQREYFGGKGIGSLVYDQRGCGESLMPTKKESYALERYVDDLKALTESIKPQGFTLVAQSSGTMIAQYYAYHHPDEVDGLVLIAPLFDTAENISRSAYGRALNHGIPLIRLLTRLLEELPPLGADGPSEGLENTGLIAGSRYYFSSSRRFRQALRLRLEAVLEWDVSWAARGVNVPTLLIHGKDDPLVSPEVTKDLKEMIPEAESHLISGDHQAQITNPEETNRLIDDFLERSVYPGAFS